MLMGGRVFLLRLLPDRRAGRGALEPPRIGSLAAVKWQKHMESIPCFTADSNSILPLWVLWKASKTQYSNSVPFFDVEITLHDQRSARGLHTYRRLEAFKASDTLMSKLTPASGIVSYL
jgi:hypothetical protein